MTCAVITTDTGSSGAQKGRSYWFPNTSTNELGGISGGTYDVWADTTSHLIADYYAGLTRWQVSHVSDTNFLAAKFQPTAPAITEDTTDQTIYNFWSQAKDYRFENGDRVDIYRMQENSSGVLEWHNKLGRTLVGPAGEEGAEILVNGLAAVAAIAFTSLF